MGLGIVLALNHMYDNWTIAGVMSAAYVLATAAVTPLYARLFDRFGQRKVGPVILTVQIIVMLGFAFAALMRVPIPLLFVLAVVMGMTQFSFGALVRTRWAYVLDRADKEDLLNTAYALESAIDEIVFIFGPILAAFLAASVHPVSQLFVPTLACAFGGAVFFALRDTQPPVLREITVVAADTDDADVRLAAGRCRWCRGFRGPFRFGSAQDGRSRPQETQCAHLCGCAAASRRVHRVQHGVHRV